MSSSSAAAAVPVPGAAPPSPAAAASATQSPAHDFPIDGFPFPFLREFIDANGGEAAFEGLTTSQVKRSIVVPKTPATLLSLCAQMRQEGDARIQPATWFVSHPWQMKFLDLVKALEAFFADKGGVIVIWLDLFSTSQHSTFSKPPEWCSRRSSPPSAAWARWSWS
jgi:hypothetical protein